MILLHFFPELLLAGLLFLTLLMMSFPISGQAFLAPGVAIATFGGLALFHLRPDLHFFIEGSRFLASDSFTVFGREGALLLVSLFSLVYCFHERLSIRERQQAVLFLEFLGLFLCALVSSNTLLLFAISSAGIFFCFANLILVEARQGESWVRVFREKSVFLGFWFLVILFLHGVTHHVFGSAVFPGWIEAVKKITIPVWGESGMLVLILLVGVLPLIGMRMSGNAPIGISVAGMAILWIVSTFWLRAGIPVLAAMGGLGSDHSRVLLGLILNGISLRWVAAAVQTRDHHLWLSSVVPAWVTLVLGTLLLPGEAGVPLFFVLSLSLLFTLTLLSKAFLDSDYRQKGLILLALLAALGLPPLVTASGLSSLIKALIDSGHPLTALGVALSWLGIIQASTQFILKVLTARNPAEQVRKFYPSEALILGIFIFGVVYLTAFEQTIQSTLNDHPLLNLW